MQEIQKKIKELLALQAEEKDYDKFDEIYNAQEKLFGELTNIARKNKTMVGRILKLGIADGQAAYVIIKENQKTVKVQWIDYVDGYCDWNLGQGQANMAKHQAQAFLQFDDYMDTLKK